MVKSSINIGLTIIFGNGNFGKIPPSGSKIIVSYIKTSGSAGNTNSTALTYYFSDMGVDEYGNDIDLNEVLQVETISPPLLGCNYEEPEYTKLVAPKTSKSFVLATPENYVSYLSKYNQFSFIYAYNTKDDYDIYDDNIIYLKILPNIKKKLTSSDDYFDLPLKEFLLDANEKQSIQDALINSGRMLVNSEVKIIDPDVKRFIINVIIQYFEGCDKTSIRTDIRSQLSTYFLNINRNDIVPLSDIVAIIEGIDGVDTCNVFFINEENETAIINRGYYTTKKVWSNLQYVDQEEYINISGEDDPRLGFDMFGNIVVGENCVAIPKGGWTDRDGNYYSEIPETGKLGPINIFFMNKVEYSAYNQTMQRRLNQLLKG